MSEITSEFKNILSQKDLLNSLANAKKNMRKAIIQNADKKLICAVCESINNALAGNVSINSSDMDHLKKYKLTFRRLIKKSPLRKKKNSNTKRWISSIFNSSRCNRYSKYRIKFNI